MANCGGYGFVCNSTKTGLKGDLFSDDFLKYNFPRGGNMLDIIIAGAGGCGREVYEMALDTYSSEEYRIRGFLSDEPDALKDFPDVREQADIIGTIVDYEPQENERFIVAIGDVQGRKHVIRVLQSKGAKFINLIHPKTIVSPFAKFGQGVILYRGAGVSAHAVIEDFCLINSMASVGHDAVVGEYSVLCPFSAIGGYAKIGKECFVGTHTTVSPRISIGKESTVSSNTFVARNVRENSFVIGVPGKEY